MGGYPRPISNRCQIFKKTLMVPRKTKTTITTTWIAPVSKSSQILIPTLTMEDSMRETRPSSWIPPTCRTRPSNNPFSNGRVWASPRVKRDPIPLSSARHWSTHRQTRGAVRVLLQRKPPPTVRSKDQVRAAMTISRIMIKNSCYMPIYLRAYLMMAPDVDRVSIISF